MCNDDNDDNNMIISEVSEYYCKYDVDDRIVIG